MTNPNPVYEIRLQGHLPERYRRWFESLELELMPQGDTRLTGSLDTAALHGILNRIRDLNLQIIHVRQVPRGESEEAER